MIINAVTKIENKKLLIKHFIDLETGEIYENIARLFDAIPKKNTNIYINDFSHISIYFCDFFAKKGFKNTINTDLAPNYFNIRAKDNCINRIILMIKNYKYCFVDYVDKFGQEFCGDLTIYNYAKENGYTKNTLASDAFEAWVKLRYGRGEKRFETMRNDFPILDKQTQLLMDKVKEQICKGYQFACVKKYDALYEMDQFSAYPAQLCGRTPKGKAFIFEDMAQVPTSYFKIITFTYTNLKLKNGYIDFIKFDLGRYDTFGTLTAPECYFRLMQQHYTFNYKITKIHAFKTELNRFKSLVNKLVIQGRKGQPKPIAKYNKALAVALVGKFGQKTIKEQCYIENGKIMRQTAEMEPIYTPLHIFVVCNQKCLLIRTHQKFKNYVAYSNTDSLLTTKIINNINDGIETTIEDLGLFRPKSMLKRVGINGINKYYAIDENNAIKTCLSGIKFEEQPTLEELETGKVLRRQYIPDYKTMTTAVKYERVRI